MHGRRLLPLTLFLLLVTASPALAGGTLTTAQFTARVSGTYTATGTVTNTKCRRVDSNGDVVIYTGTGTSSETTTFTTTRGTLFEVSKTQGQSRIGAGGFPIPVKATMTRASSLDETTDPKGCDPGAFPLRPNCGRRTKSYKLAVYGVRRGGPGFSYNFSSGFSTRTPDDPFTCPVAEAPDGGAASAPGAQGLGGEAVQPEPHPDRRQELRDSVPEELVGL
jgi:hypothetical protein